MRGKYPLTHPKANSDAQAKQKLIPPLRTARIIRPMQFTPALLLELLAWNWPRAKKLAWWARQLVKDPAAETVARHVHNEVLRILRPAESIVRRMLLILALKEPITPVPAANAGASGQPSSTHKSPVLPACVLPSGRLV